MAGAIAAQSPVPDTLPAVLGTMLVAAAFYGITAHVAARYVLGDVRIGQGLVVGAAPAVVVVGGIQLVGTGPWVVAVVVAALVADYLAVVRVYDPGRRTAGLVTVVHYAVTFLLGSLLASAVT